MRPRASVLCVLLALALIVGCGRDRHSTEQLTVGASVDAAAQPTYADGGVPVAAKQEAAARLGSAAPNVSPATQGAFPPAGVESGAPVMLVRAGHASVEVRELDAAVGALRQLVVAHAGYLAATTLQAGREQLRTATLEAKIPSERFDAFVGGLAPLGRVEAVNVTASDVGEEFNDLSARLENARRLEARLLALLANRTGKLDEVLSVERELARVREQVERIEGRLRFLRARTEMSTLAVTLREPAPIVGGAPGRNPIAEAVRTAWRNVVAVTAFTIAAAGTLLPLILLGFGAWWSARRLRHRLPVRTTQA